MKVEVPKEIEEKFRKAAMQVFGYSKGSLSKAAEKAFASWTASIDSAISLIRLPEDPVGYQYQGTGGFS